MFECATKCWCIVSNIKVIKAEYCSSTGRVQAEYRHPTKHVLSDYIDNTRLFFGGNNRKPYQIIIYVHYIILTNSCIIFCEFFVFFYVQQKTTTRKKHSDEKLLVYLQLILVNINHDYANTLFLFVITFHTIWSRQFNFDRIVFFFIHTFVFCTFFVFTGLLITTTETDDNEVGQTFTR